jgi:hypothetical protein
MQLANVRGQAGARAQQRARRKGGEGARTTAGGRGGDEAVRTVSVALTMEAAVAIRGMGQARPV